ncbi:MAG: preprotein translocase subunit YajC [Candidatus Omnitrophota bacterium]|nr:MAG: preprotein translocase subunit YajC [Candidatus Omnitrophota bacterium]
MFVSIMQISGRENLFVSMLPLFLIFAIFYFLLILPQQRMRKEHQIMLSKLSKGDRVITNGGIYATVIEVKGNIVVLKISENTKIEIQKEAIAQKLK